MNEFIPDWAKWYTIEWNDNNNGVNIEFYPDVILPAGLSHYPISNLTVDLERRDVLQQMREKPLSERIADTGALDMINEPPHYKAGEIECIDAIRAALTKEEFRGYCKGNVLKYTWRERLKGGIESIKKAIWYGKQMIEHCEDDK